MYKPNDDKQNYPFCDLNNCFENFDTEYSSTLNVKANELERRFKNFGF